MAVNESFVVEIGKRIENRIDHLSCLVGCEGTLLNDLCEYFLGIVRDCIQQNRAVDLAVARLNHRHQVRMGQIRSCFPSFKTSLGIDRIHRHKPDGSLSRRVARQLRQKDRGAFRAAQPLEQLESSINDAPYPIAGSSCVVHGGNSSPTARKAKGRDRRFEPT